MTRPPENRRRVTKWRGLRGLEMLVKLIGRDVGGVFRQDAFQMLGGLVHLPKGDQAAGQEMRTSSFAGSTARAASRWGTTSSRRFSW